MIERSVETAIRLMGNRQRTKTLRHRHNVVELKSPQVYAILVAILYRMIGCLAPLLVP